MRKSPLNDAFEQLGPETVRALLFSAESSNWEGLPPELLRLSQGKEERRAALEWLRKKDRAANIRSGLIDAMTLVTMVGACIAAWPVIKEWLLR
jgi:hypothetical protein